MGGKLGNWEPRKADQEVGSLPGPVPLVSGFAPAGGTSSDQPGKHSSAGPGCLAWLELEKPYPYYAGSLLRLPLPLSLETLKGTFE